MKFVQTSVADETFSYKISMLMIMEVHLNAQGLWEVVVGTEMN